MRNDIRVQSGAEYNSEIMTSIMFSNRAVHHREEINISCRRNINQRYPFDGLAQADELRRVLRTEGVAMLRSTLVTVRRENGAERRVDVQDDRSSNGFRRRSDRGSGSGESFGLGAGWNGAGALGLHVRRHDFLRFRYPGRGARRSLPAWADRSDQRGVSTGPQSISGG